MKWRNFLIALDKAVNAVFGGDGKETISARWGRAIRKENCILCKFICKFLDLFDPGHCEDSIKDDKND